ncbi:hypothetical protein DFH09DRAFT_1364726 [Mycena vulgaris]|nr:hypothetical protein DFH09DRAFT_1364726 [Mycena vulgaris]
MMGPAPEKEPIILSLPTEIWLEILSYFHGTPLPYERYRITHPDPGILSRFQVLHALYQTCRIFRYIFQELVWEQIEALPSPLDHPGRHVLTFKRRMMGILKTPGLPRCVKTLLVSLDISAPNWNLLTIFVRFIQAAPNLSALHIVDISDRHGGVLCERLENCSLPSVRTLAIPSSLSRMLTAFPNLRTLICSESFVTDDGAIAMLETATKFCPALDGFVNLIPESPVIKCLLTHFPRTKTLSFRHPLASDTLALLAPLHNLRSLQFPYRRYPGGDALDSVRDAARAVFQRPHAAVWVQESPPEADIGDLLLRMGVHV